MNEHEKTIQEMLAEYNRLGNELLTKFGDSFRERAGFRDRADATASLTKMQEKHKLRVESFEKQQDQEEEGPAATETTPASETEEEEQEEKMATPKKKSAKVKSVTPTKKRAAGNGTRSRFSPDAKIHLLVKDNPRRQGTDVYDQFELARKNKTVAEFVKAGGRTGTLQKGVSKKWLKVE